MRVATRHDDVDLEPDQVLGELRKPLQLPVGEAVLDHHVPSRNVAEITQAVFKGFHEVRRLLARRAHQIPDPRNTPRLLRLGGERRGEQRGSTSKERPAVHHSITWSARASSDGGMVRPRALAVLRLMTSSSVMDCWIGSSPGFAPLRILST